MAVTGTFVARRKVEADQPKFVRILLRSTDNESTSFDDQRSIAVVVIGHGDMLERPVQEIDLWWVSKTPFTCVWTSSTGLDLLADSKRILILTVDFSAHRFLQVLTIDLCIISCAFGGCAGAEAPILRKRRAKQRRW